MMTEATLLLLLMQLSIFLGYLVMRFGRHRMRGLWQVMRGYSLLGVHSRMTHSPRSRDL